MTGHGDMFEVDDLCEVTITAPDHDWLITFVHGLVADRLAAGCHITPITTVYPWRGDIHQAAESRAQLRTRTALFPLIAARVASQHPYETPSVVAIPFAAASHDYADWIRESTDNCGAPEGSRDDVAIDPT